MPSASMVAKPVRDHATAAMPPLIHIGYHKTGTTFLQNVVFAGDATSFYCPWGVQAAGAVQHLVLANPFGFDARATRRAFDAEVERCGGRTRTAVISHEALSGNPTQGRYYSREVADRLYATFPDAHILIGVREQRSMLLSLFCQQVRRRGEESLKAFIGDGANAIGFSPTCRLDYLEYNRLVAYYQRVFGADRVVVLPIELLKKDQTQYVRRVYECAGRELTDWRRQRPTNERSSGLAVALELRCNRWLGRGGASRWLTHRMCDAVERFVPRGWHERVERRWREFIDTRIQDRYREGNRELAAMTNIDLEGLGYDV